MTEIPRDRYGRPLIVPLGPLGLPMLDKPHVAYTRVSSFGEVLEDKYNLSRWQQRMVAKGLALRPDLYLAASATPLENKFKLNTIAEQAMEAAGAHTKANIGTELHSLTELVDRGEELPETLPSEHRASLDAYAELACRFEMTAIERFMVCDELQAAGTPDRLGRSLFDHAPEVQVLDLKTSGSANYLSKYACQLAIYAHSQFYDPESGQRTPVLLDEHTGWIFHVPQGEGTAQLFKVDLKQGWEAALLAADVRKYQKKKGLVTAA